jgi:alkyldihydroxyacetonephosphate synthase
MDDGINEETLKVFKAARSKLLDVIHSSGGSLSHHHGIGKKLKNRYEKTVNNVEMKMLKAIKKEVDPKNIFAVSNLLSDDVIDVPISKL